MYIPTTKPELKAYSAMVVSSLYYTPGYNWNY